MAVIPGGEKRHRFPSPVKLGDPSPTAHLPLLELAKAVQAWPGSVCQGAGYSGVLVLTIPSLHPGPCPAQRESTAQQAAYSQRWAQRNPVSPLLPDTHPRTVLYVLPWTLTSWLGLRYLHHPQPQFLGMGDSTMAHCPLCGPPGTLQPSSAQPSVGPRFQSAFRLFPGFWWEAGLALL